MRTTVVVIGAGQAGLATSRCLTEQSIDHVVLDRADVADSWRHRRWDSLRLLTPNWMSRLPGFCHRGDPEGFMAAQEVADYLSAYAVSFDAPVLGGTEVTGLRRTDAGWHVATSHGTWTCRAVVVATGEDGVPRTPRLAGALPAHLTQVAGSHYRNPAQLPEGAVLVVGAGATGVQLAEELRASGREVTICVGEHVRLPRTYRGVDIHAWMEALGVNGERVEDVDDVTRVRRTPSAQLVGSPERRSIDLTSLAAAGVRSVGRLAGLEGSTALLSGSFANTCALADLKMNRLLQRVDDHVAEHSLRVDVVDRPAPTRLPAPPTRLDLRDFTTVVWATGSRPAYPWLDARLLDRKGALRHDRGVLEAPDLYAVGLRFGRRRSSALLDGVGLDAREITAQLRARLDRADVRV